MTGYLNYIITSYLWAILMIFGGIYTLIDTIKNPNPNSRTSPLQENANGIIGGIASFVMGLVIIIAKLFYNW